MPVKYRVKKSRRTKRVNTKKYKRKTVNVNRALTPFAQRYITKMKYSEAFVLNVGNAYSTTMNLNSIWDPNSALGGHQPYGRDQLATIYNRYRVISCRYVINAYSGTNPIRYGCIASNEVPPVSNMSELCENPRAQFRLQYPQGSTTVIKGNVYLPSLMGRTKAQYMADDRFQALMINNPAELGLLYITGQTMTDAVSDILLNVTLEYTVELFDVHPLEQS